MRGPGHLDEDAARRAAVPRTMPLLARPPREQTSANVTHTPRLLRATGAQFDDPTRVKVSFTGIRGFFGQGCQRRGTVTRAYQRCCSRQGRRFAEQVDRRPEGLRPATDRLQATQKKRLPDAHCRPSRLGRRRQLHQLGSSEPSATSPADSASINRQVV